MELSSKSKIVKKKHKKKLRVSESAIKPLIKPEKFDGVSNWEMMQKVLGPITEKTKKQPYEKKKVVEIKPNSKDYKPPFSHKENIHSIDIKHSNSHISWSQHMSNKSTVKYSDVVKKSVNNFSKIPTEAKTNHKSEQVQQFTFSFNNDSAPIVNRDAQCDTQSSSKTSNTSEKKLTKAVAMDCEMVGTGPTGEDSIIARVSIVNAFGDCLYDEFVKPKEKVTDYRTSISGVRPSDLKKGKELFEVQKDVLQIIEGRILVGHAIRHDLDVLFISHPRHLIRDTAYYKPFRELCGGRTPSLKKLTSKILGCEIQSGEHSSVEDAQATMLLYLRQRREWEHEVKSQHKRRRPKINNQSES